MHATSYVYYGVDKPEEIIYTPDAVYVNVGLHRIETLNENLPSVCWVSDEVYEYTYQEYVCERDSVISRQSVVNDTQDELIADILADSVPE